MADIVKIKSFPGGLDVYLDPNVDFEELLYGAGRKFGDSAKFFGKAKVAVSFRGRDLTDEEEDRILDVITESCDVQVCCIIEQDPEGREVYLRALDRFAEASQAARGHVYKGSLKSGETLETPFSVIVLGDVNPGARVVSGGNVVILGTLYGSVYAGRLFKDEQEDSQVSGGSEDAGDGNDPSAQGLISPRGDGCFVVAMDMKPTTIRINQVRAKQGEKGFHVPMFSKGYAKIAYSDGESIRIDAVTKDFLEKLPL